MDKKPSNANAHDHSHGVNRFAVIPTADRLNADPRFTGRGVTIAFLDSGFQRHPDLVEPNNRVVAFHDINGEETETDRERLVQPWHWHGTQTTVAAAGNGHLCDGKYRGLASDARLVLVKVSKTGRISEENIARGLRWVIKNRERFNIRILNISLGGDEDVSCSQSTIDQLAEEAIRQGIVVVVAAGNTTDHAPIPPANSPSVITVGGYDDGNNPGQNDLGLYHSSFGVTAGGTVKPELIAPAMWIAAPILPNTSVYERAEALSKLAAAPDYQLRSLARELEETAELPEPIAVGDVTAIRNFVESTLEREKIVATHYQHVDGTSFAAPIISSIVAQMLEANPKLTPGAVKNILISTADRITTAPAIRQGFGVVNARRAVELALREEHELKTVGCSPPRVENGRLVFLFHDDAANSVSLVGDFNSWNTALTPLRKDESGLWLAEVEAPKAGNYQYKFIVDGSRWLEDPSNGMKVPDNYGGLNSVLTID
ncbi:MAG TPA: S8 family serine peptidase [Pyrinomonadaceae bacterium]|jgi:serine protease AprX|nr:S8 family serine peptidase [Pyrinomonadaceae bacterium]